MCEEGLQREELTVFAHLGSRETDKIAVYLCREGLWDQSSMVYDCDSTLLMTKTAQAKEIVIDVLAKFNLLPEGATTFSAVAV